MVPGPTGGRHLHGPVHACADGTVVPRSGSIERVPFVRAGRAWARDRIGHRPGAPTRAPRTSDRGAREGDRRLRSGSRAGRATGSAAARSWDALPRRQIHAVAPSRPTCRRGYGADARSGRQPDRGREDVPVSSVRIGRTRATRIATLDGHGRRRRGWLPIGLACRPRLVGHGRPERRLVRWASETGRADRRRKGSRPRAMVRPFRSSFAAVRCRVGRRAEGCHRSGARCGWYERSCGQRLPVAGIRSRPAGAERRREAPRGRPAVRRGVRRTPPGSADLLAPRPPAPRAGRRGKSAVGRAHDGLERHIGPRIGSEGCHRPTRPENPGPQRSAGEGCSGEHRTFEAATPRASAREAGVAAPAAALAPPGKDVDTAARAVTDAAADSRTRGRDPGVARGGSAGAAGSPGDRILFGRTVERGPRLPPRRSPAGPAGVPDRRRPRLVRRPEAGPSHRRARRGPRPGSAPFGPWTVAVTFAFHPGVGRERTLVEAVAGARSWRRPGPAAAAAVGAATGGRARETAQVRPATAARGRPRLVPTPCLAGRTSRFGAAMPVRMAARSRAGGTRLPIPRRRAKAPECRLARRTNGGSSAGIGCPARGRSRSARDGEAPGAPTACAEGYDRSREGQRGPGAGPETPSRGRSGTFRERPDFAVRRPRRVTARSHPAGETYPTRRHPLRGERRAARCRPCAERAAPRKLAAPNSAPPHTRAWASGAVRGGRSVPGSTRLAPSRGESSRSRGSRDGRGRRAHFRSSSTGASPGELAAPTHALCAYSHPPRTRIRMRSEWGALRHR